MLNLTKAVRLLAPTVLGAAVIAGCAQHDGARAEDKTEVWERAAKTGAAPHAPGWSTSWGRNVHAAETPPSAPRAEEPRRTVAAPAPRTGSVIAAYPTGHTRTPQLMVEKIAPSSVALGQEFTYEYRLTNHTDTAIEDIYLTEQRSPHFRFISSDPRESSSSEWFFQSLAPGETQVIRITGSASDAQTITSCADVRYKVPLCSSTQVVEPALQLALTGPSQVLLCDPFALEVVVRNPGTGIATNVTVDVALPRGLETLDGKTTVTLAAGDLAPGQAKAHTVQVKASSRGSYDSTAKATGGALTAESETVTTRVVQPTLTIECESPERRFVDRPIDFVVTVGNTGDAPATNTVVEQTLPAGVTVTSISDGGALRDGKVVWNLGTLAVNATHRLTVGTTASNIGSYTANASVRADCATTVSCPTTTAVEGIPALLLEGFDDPDPVEIGNTTTYTLIVTNQGSAPLTNVRLLCTMDEGDTMEFVSAAGTTPAGPITGSPRERIIEFPPIARLEPGRNATYKIVIRAKNEGQVSFRAECVSNEISRPLIKVETTNFYR